MTLFEKYNKVEKSLFNPKSPTRGDLDDIDINLIEDMKIYIQLHARDILPTIFAKLLFKHIPDNMLVGSKPLTSEDKINGRSEIISLIKMLKEEFRLNVLKYMTWKSTGNTILLLNSRKTLKFIVKIDKRFEIVALPNY